jgi:hypothetical protein
MPATAGIADFHRGHGPLLRPDRHNKQEKRGFHINFQLSEPAKRPVASLSSNPAASSGIISS